MNYDPLREEPTAEHFVVLSCGCITTLEDHCGTLIHRYENGESAEWVYRSMADVPLFIRECDKEGSCLPLCFRIGLQTATALSLDEYERVTEA